MSPKDDAGAVRRSRNPFIRVVLELKPLFSAGMIYCLSFRTLAIYLPAPWSRSRCRTCLTNSVEGRMWHMKNVLKRLWRDEEGQDLVEYGLLLVLIALAALAAIGPIGTGVSKVFSAAASNLTVS